ncbi:hypothetical protein Q8A73_023315 [Channa argus]|nr:hypothetical protein Q8A73_023315 [Channa argus]
MAIRAECNKTRIRRWFCPHGPSLNVSLLGLTYDQCNSSIHADTALQPLSSAAELMNTTKQRFALSAEEKTPAASSLIKAAEQMPTTINPRDSGASSSSGRHRAAASYAAVLKYGLVWEAESPAGKALIKEQGEEAICILCQSIMFKSLVMKEVEQLPRIKLSQAGSRDEDERALNCCVYESNIHTTET